MAKTVTGTEPPAPPPPTAPPPEPAPAPAPADVVVRQAVRLEEITEPPAEGAPVLEVARRLVLLRVVDRHVAGEHRPAPFHQHSVAGHTFARFTMRPSRTGELDERGRLFMERIPGSLAWVTDEQLLAIRDRLKQRFIDWMPGRIPSKVPGGPDTIVPRQRGIVRIVAPGKNPEPTWEPVGHYLRVESVPE